MRGLPPIPSDIARLTQSFDIGGLPVSIGFWLFNGSWNEVTPPSAAGALADWLNFCLPSILELCHSATIPTTCRIVAAGLSYAEQAPPAHGAWSGGQASNVSLGLHWLTGEHGRGQSKITFLPGVPDVFVTDNYRPNDLAIGNLLASGTDLYHQLNNITAPDGTPCIVGTVHRARAGAPLPSTTFSPYIGVIPTTKLVTIRRRVPRGSRVSPS